MNEAKKDRRLYRGQEMGIRDHKFYASVADEIKTHVLA